MIAEEVKRIIKEKVTKRKWFGPTITMRDDNYELYPMSVVVEKMDGIKQPLPYRTDVWDCDDMADWNSVMLRKALPGVAVFYIKAQNKVVAHGFTGVVCTNEEVIFFDGDLVSYPNIIEIRVP